MTAATLERTETGSRNSGSTFAGTGTMIRFMLRRDRIRLPVWIAALAGAILASHASDIESYPTAADRQAVIDVVNLPAMTAVVGRSHGSAEDGFGPILGMYLLIVTVVFALMTVTTVVRHTRVEEEAGRSELIRSNVLGRHAQLMAALTVAGGASIVAGLLTGVGLAAMGADGITFSGSLLFGAAIGAAGLLFATVAGVTAQITAYARGASGMAIAVLGGAYAVRSVGDVGDNAISWASPLSWAQNTRPFSDGERWWPLLLVIGLASVLAVVAFQLSTRRDVGAGLRPPTPGPAEANRAFSTPGRLAIRLQRPALIAWVLGLFGFGLVYGSIIDAVDDMVEQVPALRDMVAQTGGSLSDGFLVSLLSLLAMIGAVPALLAVSRLRSEETAGRAEPILATAVSRTRWMASHLSVAFVAGAVIVLAAGLGLGVAAATVTGDWSVLGDVLRGTLGYVPAVWVVVGLAAALFGLVPNALGLAWAVPAYSVAVVYLGGLFGFPAWTADLSPFGHVPQVPAEPFEALPLVVLLVVGAALTALGIAGFRRRDLTTT